MEKHQEKLKKKTDSPSAGIEEHSCPTCDKDGQAESKKGGLSSLLKLGACCAAPILALVFLAPLLGSGAGGLAAIAGNLLAIAAVLACPLGMYFMMRGMMKQGHGDHKREPDERPAPKVLPPDGKGKAG